MERDIIQMILIFRMVEFYLNMRLIQRQEILEVMHLEIISALKIMG